MSALCAAVLAVAGPAGSALAQTAPPTPTLTKTVVVAGDSVGVSGSGCVAATQVQVQLDSVTVVTVTSADGGTYSALLVVPTSVTAGQHPVTVVCTGPNGTVTANATITVSPTATTGYSPRTSLVVATLLVLLGGMCFVATARRPRRPVRVRSR
jgi:hypothetical protein